MKKINLSANDIYLVLLRMLCKVKPYRAEFCISKKLLLDS